MKCFFTLLLVCSISVFSKTAYADLIRPTFFSDIKHPQRCENLCEVLKQRLIGVSDKEKQERLLRDYDECKASYDKAINSNSQNRWCVHIYTSPCRSACWIKCGSTRCARILGDKSFPDEESRRKLSYWNEVCSAEARKECREKKEKRCAECEEREKESWHTYLHEYLRKPKEITSLPEQSPNNAKSE
ncbi:MAG: hypothetical protein IKV03_05535 [Alphaproteobacteria bacterium]|nr:hypothetical protein [Alphaproteobacteria bacterium]